MFFQQCLFEGILSTAKMGEELLDSIASGLTQNFTQETQIWVTHFVTAFPSQITRHEIYFKAQCEHSDIKATEP